MFKNNILQSSNSPYQPDKSAGVDSLGLLAGALGMSEIKVFNVWNEDIGDGANDVANFIPGNWGLDNNDGYPVFYTGQDNTFLYGNYRISRNDLERCTVLVPDVSFIQKGDLLVRYDTTDMPTREDIHVGIVVGLGWDANSTDKPEFGDDPDEWMQKVYVISVRRGFQCVTIGTWGNPTGSFGGFTDDPESYQIRRLLKKTDQSDPADYEEVSWECVKETVTRSTKSYPPPNYYPISPEKKNTKKYGEVECSGTETVNTYYIYEEYDTPEDAYSKYPVEGLRTSAASWHRYVDKLLLFRLKEGQFSFYQNEKGSWVPMGTALHFYEYYPPTSWSNVPVKSLFKKTDNSGKIVEDVMLFANPTGFRKITGPSINNITYDLIDYHSAIDVTYQKNGNYDYGHDIYAPESGILYYFVPEKADFIKVGKNDSDDSKLKLNKFSQDNGFIGVLITNPENPQNGRVYLFCHMGAGNEPNEQGWPVIVKYNEALLDFQKYFIEKYPGKDFPQEFESAISVNAGDWIGKVGIRGWAGIPHIHLEVYEHFPEDEVFMSNQNLQFQYRGKWKRIDPISLWNTTQYTLWTEPHDTVKDLIKSKFGETILQDIFIPLPRN